MEVKIVKAPNRKEVRVPTTFSNYKEVNGVLFPYEQKITAGPQVIGIAANEIVINEGVSEEDFK